MKKQISATIVLALACTTSTFADVAQLDQSHEVLPTDSNGTNIVSYGFGPTNDHAQTFTVGTSGQLSAVEISVLRGTSIITTPVRFDIRTVNLDGTPTTSDSGSNILASMSIDATEFADSNPLSTFPVSFDIPYTHIDVSAFDIDVTVGDSFAIVVQSDYQPLGIDPRESYQWIGSRSGGAATIAPDPYLGGAAYSGTSDSFWALAITGPAGDFGFRTFVTVPEPSSLAVLAIGGFGVLVRRRRR